MLVNVSIGAAYVVSENIQYCQHSLHIINLITNGLMQLYMRRAIVDTGLGQLDGTYYNNALSIPLLVPCIYMFNEIPNLITRYFPVHVIYENNLHCSILSLSCVVSHGNWIITL